MHCNCLGLFIDYHYICFYWIIFKQLDYLYTHIPFIISFHVTYWPLLYRLPVLIYSQSTSYSLLYSRSLLPWTCVVIIFHFMLWCGLVCLYKNHICLRYTVHAMEVNIVFWIQRAALGEKLLFRQPIRIHSWHKVSSVGWRVFGIAQEQSHISLYSDQRCRFVIIDRDKSHNRVKLIAGKSNRNTKGIGIPFS